MAYNLQIKEAVRVLWTFLLLNQVIPSHAEFGSKLIVRMAPVSSE